MAISYSLAVKNARLQKVIDFIDAQAGNGAIKIYQSDGVTLLSSVPLSKPSFTVDFGQMNLAEEPVVDLNAANTGIAAKAKIVDGNGTVIVDGLTVGIASDVPTPDVVLDKSAIAAGDQVIINAGSITHA